MLPDVGGRFSGFCDSSGPRDVRGIGAGGEPTLEPAYRGAMFDSLDDDGAGRTPSYRFVKVMPGKSADVMPALDLLLHLAKQPEQRSG